MSYDLVGIGNALVDIEVQVSEDMVHDLEITKGGMTLSTKENQDAVLKHISNHTQKIVSGGSAANTIHGFSTLGGKSYYLGRVADDSLGKTLHGGYERTVVSAFPVQTQSPRAPAHA